jgi:hypothetical protein
VHKKPLIFSIVCALLALGVYSALEYFEIRSETVWEGPSRKARMNAYLALERWLEKTGHPVQTVTKKSDESVFAQRKVFCVQASALDWTENTPAAIFSWIRDGGFLFLHWDTRTPENANTQKFLKTLGLRTQAAPETKDPQPQEGFPDFDRRFTLKPIKENPNRPRMLLRKDPGGHIRLAALPLGQGGIALGGEPLFMRSSNLKKAENARLAWELTGAKDSAGEGIVFIRAGIAKDTMYEAFSARGSLVFVIASALVLIITGFWTAIPAFGRPKIDQERPGRPLEERFLAEGSFLKKFGALDSYLDTYRKEIRLKSRLGSDKTPEALAGLLAPLCGMDEKTIREALSSRRGVKFREFIKQRKILKTLWESL